MAPRTCTGWIASRTLPRSNRSSRRRPGRVALWLAGHTHTHPDDSFGGKTHIEQRWGTWFLNVASLSRHHMPITTLPISRLLTFEPGSDEVRVQCYLHTSQYAPQGWYEKSRRR